MNRVNAMSRPIIEVDMLSKRYRLGQFNARSLRDEVARLIVRRAPQDAEVRKMNGSEFWALRDASFSIKAGEVVGIIGSNGAGKSTLLKILSRVTEPTSGKVTMRGRSASLLEVGTGFHPELTGRENVFLNGAILGMTRAEVRAKFDEIAAFADIDQFLDTPVKRYSSGMYVRLAFSVAAHLDPDILIVDEALAVGDAAFQRKCLGKMRDISDRGGRTVLFVSHSLGAIASLCDRGILLEKGRILCDGPTSDVIKRYYDSIGGVGSAERGSASVCLDSINDARRRGAREFSSLKSITVLNAALEPCTSFAMGDTLVIRLGVEFTGARPETGVGVTLRNKDGQLIHEFRSSFSGVFPEVTPGVVTYEINVPELRVYPGDYSLGAWVQQRVGVASDDLINNALEISVVDQKSLGHPRSDFGLISTEGTEVYHPSRWDVL